jgi:hypothetical protein
MVQWQQNESAEIVREGQCNSFAFLFSEMFAKVQTTG